MTTQPAQEPGRDTGGRATEPAGSGAAGDAAPAKESAAEEAVAREAVANVQVAAQDDAAAKVETAGKTETAARASAAVSGGDPVAGLNATEVAAGLRDLLRPEALIRQGASSWLELSRVALGVSKVAPKPRDRRFADPAFTSNPVYRRLAQSYLVWADSVDKLVDTLPEGDPGCDYAKFRARSVGRLMTDALAPTNFLPGNPAALKKAFDTAGGSLAKGARNFASDVVTNRGLPSQVDSRPYRVGENLAATPGAVVYREEMFELLQYAPTTPTVGSRPLLVVPPQVNKHYFLDLAPGRSLVEYVVGQGVSTFLIVWRNPDAKVAEHGRWGMDDYVAAQLRALHVVRTIASVPDVNVLGACAGGLSSAIMLGHLAARAEEGVHSLTLAISMLDTSRTNVIKLLATRATRGQLARDAERGKVYDRQAVAHNFAWMRPNDLIFNYVVNNWLMGEDPPAFDILAWNNDSTALSARFDADMLDLYAENALAEPGKVSSLGTPIDLAKVGCDVFVVAGMTDHITPWKPCYLSTQLFSGGSEVVITSTGHIQTIVNPPGKARARYFAGPAAPGQTPEQWLEAAEEHSDSWWPRYGRWLRERSGADREAPAELGAPAYPVLAAAPGSYVLG